MNLLLTNTHVKVHQATPREVAWLRSFLTFEDESKRFRRGRDGRAHVNKNAHTTMFEGFSQTFPAGMLAMVVREAKKEGVVAQVVDRRDWPFPGVRSLDDLFKATKIPTNAIDWLRDYQRESVEVLVRRTRGLIHASTGSGKGDVLAAMTMVIPIRWLVIVPEKSLLENAAKRIEKYALEDVGRIGDGMFDDSKRVTVATYQSLDRAFRPLRRGASDHIVEKRKRIRALLDDVEALAYDEVHQAAADGSYRISMHTPRAFYRVGFSATPLKRGDRRSILSVAAYGEVIQRVTTEELIEAGFVSRPSIVMVPCAQTGKSSTWQGAYTELVVKSSKRNHLAVELARKAPKPALVFVSRVQHGRDLARKISRAGMSCEFVWGDKKSAQREDVIRRLRNGTLDVCVCNVVFQTGVDIPELRGIVNVAAGKSSIATIQRVGRGARIAKDKDSFLVYDILDRDAGHKTAAKHVEKQAKRRRRDYVGEGWSVSVDETLGAQIALSKSR